MEVGDRRGLHEMWHLCWALEGEDKMLIDEVEGRDISEKILCRMTEKYKKDKQTAPRE